MKQKIVIKVHIDCEKCRIRAMKVATSALGVNTVAVEGDQLVVSGVDVDAAKLTRCLRKKVGYAMLVALEEVKDKQPEPEKNDRKESGKKKKEKEKNEECPQRSIPCPPCPPYYCPPPCPQFYMYDVPADHSPLCIIM
ncbi:hypothetical protein Ancab_034695 [Ancistrocladus abbreviatus]